MQQHPWPALAPPEPLSSSAAAWTWAARGEVSAEGSCSMKGRTSPRQARAFPWPRKKEDEISGASRHRQIGGHR